MHLRQVLAERPEVPWFEVHICNYLSGGINRVLLEKIREYYPLSFHGVNLNLGGVDPLEQHYLQQLKQIVDELEPVLISEHACFTTHNGHYLHDLLPVPFTEDAVIHMAERISKVQDVLGRQILLENVTRYCSYEDSELTEVEFYREVSEKADCGLLLDLNNIYVNAHNLGDSIENFIDELPRERVQEIHLAGYSESDGWWIDSHSEPISEGVWQLYEHYAKQFPGVPCLIEWDSNLPKFSQLYEYQGKAQSLYKANQPVLDTAV